MSGYPIRIRMPQPPTTEEGLSVQREAAAPWAVREHGMDLLKQLDDLALQTEANLWTSGALFGAAQGVLLLAYFSVVTLAASNASARAFAVVWTGLIATTGLVFSAAWVGVSVILLGRRELWVGKARGLQTQLGIPETYAPWTSEFVLRTNADFAPLIAVAILAALWVALLVNVV